MLNKISHSNWSKAFIIGVFFSNINLLTFFGGEFNPIIPLSFSVLYFLTSLRLRRFSLNPILSFRLLCFSFILLLIGLYFLLSPSFNSALISIKYLIGPFIFLTLCFSGIKFRYDTAKLLLLSLSAYYILVQIGILDNVNHILFTRGSEYPSAPLVKEPSYFYYYILLAAVIFEKSIYDEKIIIKKEVWLLRLSIITMGLFTGSLLNYVFVLTYFVALLKLKTIFILSVSSIFSFTFLLNSLPGRLQKILELIGKELNFYDLMIIEPSGTTRLILNYISFKQIFIEPFGNGLASFGLTLNQFLGLNPIYFKHSVVGKEKIYMPSTYFASFANDLGIFVLLVFLFILPFKINLKSGLLKKLIYPNLFIMIFFQSPLTNVVFWVIIFYLHEKQAKNISSYA